MEAQKLRCLQARPISRWNFDIEKISFSRPPRVNQSRLPHPTMSITPARFNVNHPCPQPSDSMSFTPALNPNYSMSFTPVPTNTSPCLSPPPLTNILACLSFSPIQFVGYKRNSSTHIRADQPALSDQPTKLTTPSPLLFPLKHTKSAIPYLSRSFSE